MMFDKKDRRKTLTTWCTHYENILILFQDFLEIFLLDDTLEGVRDVEYLRYVNSEVLSTCSHQSYGKNENYRAGSDEHHCMTN